MKNRIIKNISYFLSFRKIDDDIEDLKKLNQNAMKDEEEGPESDVYLAERPYVSIR